MKQKPDITRKDLPIPHLPAQWEGLRICHLSDIHDSSRADYGEEIRRAAEDFAPELLVVTGDLIDCREDFLGEYFFSILDRLPAIPTVCCVGNHEMRLHIDRKPKRLTAQLEQRGIPLLWNESVSVPLRGSVLPVVSYLQPFRSVSDRHRSRLRLRQDITQEDLQNSIGAPPEEFFLLLAHDPAPFPAYARWGAPLTLSGHIHGGQIRLPGIGGLLSPARRFFPTYSDGVYAEGDSRLVVSRGLCVGKLPRIGNPPEIGLWTLTREGKK